MYFFFILLCISFLNNFFFNCAAWLLAYFTSKHLCVVCLKASFNFCVTKTKTECEACKQSTSIDVFTLRKFVLYFFLFVYLMFIIFLLLFFFRCVLITPFGCYYSLQNSAAYGTLSNSNTLRRDFYRGSHDSLTVKGK